MVAPMAFSGQAPAHSLPRLALGALPSRGRQPAHIQTKSLQTYRCKKLRAKQFKTHVASSMSDSKMGLNPSSSDTVKKLYLYINDKNLKQLGNLISTNCIFEDSSFSKPFQGKKEVLHFLEQLITSMGQNIEFEIENVFEGDEFTASALWHLEWKKKRIPLTRGCSFYELSVEEQRLVIRKALVVVESPIKPGGLVLGLLKVVTSLFDAFPEAAEWFLRSSHVILQMLVRIYKILLGTFISPLLAGYINFWSFIIHVLSFSLKLLLSISKFLSN